MAGLSTQLSGMEIHRHGGQICQDLNWAFERAIAFKEFLDANTDLELQTLYQIMGVDAAVFRSAFADLQQLRQLYRGNGTLPVAKDFRVFVSELYGLGFRT